jgi:WD and tetratricopeptide repeat-containing protein 1
MPRHNLSTSSRTLAPPITSGSKRGIHDDPSVWSRMDRAQVLGTPAEGHRGCVNALSWSDDGSTLLSGSDDKRICIWASDPSASTSLSPHPFKLLDTIATGHRANIFSAKYLPNTSTPTIVSCAGDRDVRVFEVERLGRTSTGIGMTGRDELYGGDGPG